MAGSPAAGSAAAGSFRFPRAARLTRGADLDTVRREGKRIRTSTLEVRAVASLLSHSRVGLIVPKYRHSGVARNLVKRRLRELSRTRLLPALASTFVDRSADVVIRAMPGAYDATFETLGADVQRAIEALARNATLPMPAAAAPALKPAADEGAS